MVLMADGIEKDVFSGECFAVEGLYVAFPAVLELGPEGAGLCMFCVGWVVAEVVFFYVGCVGGGFGADGIVDEKHNECSEDGYCGGWE